MTRRVAITGLGAVTPLGNDVASTWQGLAAGRSGIGPLTAFDAATFAVRIAGQVEGFDLATAIAPLTPPRHLSRVNSFGFAAAAEALRQAGVPTDAYGPYERGVSLGCSAGRIGFQELSDTIFTVHESGGMEHGRQAPRDVLERNPNIGMAAIADLGGCRGPVIGVSTACAASLHAVGEAFRCIQEGDARLMITGGFDALTTYLDVLGFTLLGALNDGCNEAPERASRPFSDDRQGFVLGEGAAIMVLEEWEGAVARGATILGEIAGYGSSMNAYRMTDAPPDGAGPDLAMSNALADAHLTPHDIDFIVAHGTGTPGNDLCETNAIKTVLGADAYRVVVTAPKAAVGHTTAASGALNVLVAVCAMREGLVPPTINLDTPDPKLDLDYVPLVSRALPLRAAIVNAFAFGGTNGALVVRRAEC